MDLRRFAAWATPWTLAGCAACEVALPLGDHGLCRACAEAVEPLHAQVSRLGPDGPWLVAGVRYGGPIAEVFAAVKFRGRPPDLGSLTPPWLATCSEVAASTQLDAWVAVPPQRRRLRRRGWHLPDLLAATLAAATTRPASLLLNRDDQHAPRAIGSADAPCFSLRQRIRSLPARVGLVDDIVTTGTTLREAMTVLERAGIAVCCVAVLADARARATIAAAG